MQSERFEWDDEKAEENLAKHGVSFNEVLVVTHTLRGERIRVISARHANRAERRKFMNEKFDRIRDKETDDMRPHYEFDYSKAVRGKYYNPRHSVTTLMRIDNDIAEHFSSVEELNNALRTLIAEGRVPGPRKA